VAVAVLAASAASCQEGSEEPEQPREPLVVFDTVAAVIVTARDTIPLTVELADTDEKKAYGMMERTELPEHRGMLFTYDEPQQADRPFWMYRTLLPLDIAFLDESGRIVAIRAMDPCLSPNPELCRLYAPGVRYAGALEVGQGLLERWGVDLGDRVVVSDRSPD
jgi:hypothetical protein